MPRHLGKGQDRRERHLEKTVEVKDQFYVNCHAIKRTLSKNGKDLDPRQARKKTSA